MRQLIERLERLVESRDSMSLAEKELARLKKIVANRDGFAYSPSAAIDTFNAFMKEVKKSADRVAAEEGDAGQIGDMLDALKGLNPRIDIDEILDILNDNGFFD